MSAKNKLSYIVITDVTNNSRFVWLVYTVYKIVRCSKVFSMDSFATERPLETIRTEKGISQLPGFYLVATYPKLLKET